MTMEPLMISSARRVFSATAMSTTVAAALLAAVLVAPAASANSGGVTGRSGKGGSTCTSCHGSNTPAPTIAVTGLDGPLTAGTTALFSITIHRVGDTTHVGTTCVNRCAGFDAAVDGTGATAAGTFIAVAD